MTKWVHEQRREIRGVHVLSRVRRHIGKPVDFSGGGTSTKKKICGWRDTHIRISQ